jgi:hypothetical protein
MHDYFTRLLFIGLWNYVDDNGVGLDDEALIAGKLFAQDFYQHPDDIRMRIHGGLTELSLSTQIKRYFDGKHHLLAIVNWDKHQNINRPSKSDYKRPEELPETVAIIEEPNLFTEDSVSAHGGLSGGIGNREEGIGKREVKEPVKKTSRSYSPEFESFWTLYPKPRRKEKPKAYEEWKKALKRVDSPSVILGGLNAYLTGDTTYAPYPAKWLRNDSWEDGPDARADTSVSKATQNLQHNQQMVLKYMTTEERERMGQGQQPLGLGA